MAGSIVAGLQKYMLADEQPFYRIQGYIEGILAGGFAAAGIIVIAVVIFFRLGIDLVDGTRKSLVLIRPGAHQHGHPFIQAVDGLLADGTLDAEIRSGHNGDIVAGLAVIPIIGIRILRIVFLYGADGTRYGRFNFALLQSVFSILRLLPLALELVFVLFDAQRYGLLLDLQIVELGRLGLFDLLLQGRQFFRIGLNGIL